MLIRERPFSSGADGRAAFEMITAIHQSHQAGRHPIDFPLQDRDLRIESNWDTTVISYWEIV